jgi:UDP-N-acetyl-D-galactosamine dehydrogenase
MMGLTFKENCPDLRNTGVVLVIEELESYGAKVEVYDPWVDKDEARSVYNVKMVDQPPTQRYDAIIAAVAHREFIGMDQAEIRSFCRENAVIYDVKHLLQDGVADASL